MELEILYEDNHLIVVIKPQGILSQRDCTGDSDLLTIIKDYLKNKYQKPGDVYLGLVHRLDRMTSGVMVFAKTSKAASRLNQAIQNHQFHKKYLAVVEGIIKDGGTLEDQLFKNTNELKAYVVKNGKPAILNYQPLSTNSNETILDIELITGRYHQIRIQLANFGHPLVGDSLYGSKRKSPIRLHAYMLSFPHPISTEQLVFTYYPPWCDILHQ